MCVLNIASTLNYDNDNKIQDFNKIAAKTETCSLFACSMAFAGLDYPVSNNPNLTGGEGQIRI